MVGVFALGSSLVQAVYRCLGQGEPLSEVSIKATSAVAIASLLSDNPHDHLSITCYVFGKSQRRAFITFFCLSTLILNWKL